MGVDFTGFDNEEEFGKPFFVLGEEMEVEEHPIDVSPRRAENPGMMSNQFTTHSIPDERTPINPNRANQPQVNQAQQTFPPDSFEGQVRAKCEFVESVLKSIGQFFKDNKQYGAVTGMVGSQKLRMRAT